MFKFLNVQSKVSLLFSCSPIYQLDDINTNFFNDQTLEQNSFNKTPTTQYQYKPLEQNNFNKTPTTQYQYKPLEQNSFNKIPTTQYQNKTLEQKLAQFEQQYKIFIPTIINRLHNGETILVVPDNEFRYIPGTDEVNIELCRILSEILGEKQIYLSLTILNNSLKIQIYKNEESFPYLQRLATYQNTNEIFKEITKIIDNNTKLPENKSALNIQIRSNISEDEINNITQELKNMLYSQDITNGLYINRDSHYVGAYKNPEWLDKLGKCLNIENIGNVIGFDTDQDNVFITMEKGSLNWKNGGRTGVIFLQAKSQRINIEDSPILKSLNNTINEAYNENFRKKTMEKNTGINPFYTGVVSFAAGGAMNTLQQ